MLLSLTGYYKGIGVKRGRTNKFQIPRITMDYFKRLGDAYQFLGSGKVFEALRRTYKQEVLCLIFGVWILAVKSDFI